MKRKLTASLLGLYAAPLNFVLKRTKPHFQKVVKSELFKHIYSDNEYCMMSFFPKSIEGMQIKGTDNDFSDVVIVIQGPIAERDNFTANTIRMYRQYYNNVKIVVSSWIDSDRNAVKDIEKTGASIVLNEYPDFNGYGNINYQLTNSLAGVKRAREMGAKYVLKTRSDQRFYNPCALSLLKGLYQEDKIILMGGVANSFYSRCFYISDFMSYGSIDDIELLYSCDLGSEDEKRILDENKHSARFFEYVKLINRAESDCTVKVPEEYNDAPIRYGCAEIFLAHNYYHRKIDQNKHLTAQEEYDDFLRNYALVVDADSLGFYWLKYDYQVFRQTWFDRLGKLDVGKRYSIIQKQKYMLKEKNE